MNLVASAPLSLPIRVFTMEFRLGIQWVHATLQISWIHINVCAIKDTTNLLGSSVWHVKQRVHVENFLHFKGFVVLLIQLTIPPANATTGIIKPLLRLVLGVCAKNTVLLHWEDIIQEVATLMT
jgi:hypothetical protein